MVMLYFVYHLAIRTSFGLVSWWLNRRFMVDWAWNVTNHLISPSFWPDGALFVLWPTRFGCYRRFHYLNCKSLVTRSRKQLCCWKDQTLIISLIDLTAPGKGQAFVRLDSRLLEGYWDQLEAGCCQSRWVRMSAFLAGDDGVNSKHRQTRNSQR